MSRSHWQTWGTALAVALGIVLGGCTAIPTESAEQWKVVELVLTSQKAYENPYTDVEVWVEFTHDSESLIRPAFWDGGNTWKVRFTSTQPTGGWEWVSRSIPVDSGLDGIRGKLECRTPANTDGPQGLLRMSPRGRNLVYSDGTPMVLVGDTPWALPWRADLDAVRIYASDRKAKGFNSALLMTVCPDRDAQGPDARMTEGGFARAFSDLPAGHLNQPDIQYFQYFDQITGILLDHGIVPVYQPVFHGYGWKGQNILGWNVVPEEYARYCRYLVARYGARPAIWLVSGDSDGMRPGVLEGGQEFERWDAYRQPAGNHYSPFDDYRADWMEADAYLHFNRTHQDAEWLDFQWCQTGHGGEHLYHKVARMYDERPVKAVANGEPTYEGIRDPSNGAGWWQGEEAWMQLLSGGTMGVVYGAGGLWNWKISADETGWPDWAHSAVSWREALDLEGGRYVGLVAKALAGVAFADLEKRWDLAGDRPCLARPGELYVVWLADDAPVTLSELRPGLEVRWFNPRSGDFTCGSATTKDREVFQSPQPGPMVLIVGR